MKEKSHIHCRCCGGEFYNFGNQKYCSSRCRTINSNINKYGTPDNPRKVNVFGFIKCKRCGGSDVYPIICFAFSPHKHTAKCNYCKAEIGYFESEEKAIKEWNKINIFKKEQLI